MRWSFFGGWAVPRVRWKGLCLKIEGGERNGHCCSCILTFSICLLVFWNGRGVALMAISNNGTNPPLQLLCGVSTLGVRPGVTKTSTRKGLNILKAGSSCFYLQKVMALRKKFNIILKTFSNAWKLKKQNYRNWSYFSKDIVVFIFHHSVRYI